MSVNINRDEVDTITLGGMRVTQAWVDEVDNVLSERDQEIYDSLATTSMTNARPIENTMWGESTIASASVPIRDRDFLYDRRTDEINHQTWREWGATVASNTGLNVNVADVSFTDAEGNTFSLLKLNEELQKLKEENQLMKKEMELMKEHLRFLKEV